MSQPKLHTRVFSIEGIPDPYPPDHTAAIIAAGVIGTLRDHLLRDNLQHWTPWTTELQEAERSKDIINLVCKVPGVEAGPGLWRFPPPMMRGRRVEVVRTNPARIAEMCTRGLRRLFVGTDLLREGQFYSGPESISVVDMREYIKALPQLSLESPVPATADDYVTNIQRAASSIFGKVTGSQQVPAVTCDITRLNGSTFSS